MRIIAELDSANNITSRFVYTTSENVPEYFEKSDTIYRIITDHLGSVRQVVNASTGEIIQKIDYDEYGNVSFDSNPGFIPFGYAGGLYDNHTKLVRFGERDYDAISGRWTAKDPIGFGGGVSNLFEYCVNDPINFIDSKGTQWEWWVNFVKSIKNMVGFGEDVNDITTTNNDFYINRREQRKDDYELLKELKEMGEDVEIYENWMNWLQNLERITENLNTLTPGYNKYGDFDTAIQRQQFEDFKNQLREKINKKKHCK